MNHTNFKPFPTGIALSWEKNYFKSTGDFQSKETPNWLTWRQGGHQDGRRGGDRKKNGWHGGQHGGRQGGSVFVGFSERVKWLFMSKNSSQSWWIVQDTIQRKVNESPSIAMVIPPPLLWKSTSAARVTIYKIILAQQIFFGPWILVNDVKQYIVILW